MAKSVCIAHGGDVSKPGGGTNRVIEFARALNESDFKVHLVVPTPEMEYPQTLEGVNIHKVPIRARGVNDQFLRGFLVSIKSKKIAERENSILQIEHSTLGGIASLLGCSNYVLDIHDLGFGGDLYKSIPLAPKIVYHLEKRSVKRAAKIIVVSEEMKNFILDKWKIDESKIEIIPNGTYNKVSIFKTDEEIEGLVSFLGVLTKNVDYHKIIKLAKELEDIKIYVIGDGTIRKELLDKLKREGINNVVVPGYLPDKEAYKILAESQVCLFPLRDTFHTKVAMHMKTLDYAALGKPIATDRDATGNIFARNNAALVSDPSDPSEFIENVKRLLKDEELRRTLSKNAKNLVRSYTWEKQGRKLVEMYNGILTKSK